MVLTIAAIMTTKEEHYDTTTMASSETHTDEIIMNIQTFPIKCHDEQQHQQQQQQQQQQRTRKPSKRTSWKFNTDWEGAISSFRSATSSILTASFNSWYHILDIEDEDDSDSDEDDIDDTDHVNRERIERKIHNRGKKITMPHVQENLRRHSLSKEKSFKRSVHSTLLSDEMQTSFRSSMGDDHTDNDDIVDMKEYYLDTLKRGGGKSRSESTIVSNVKDQDNTFETLDDATTKQHRDDTDLFHCLTELIDKEQWDVTGTGLQDLNQDSDKHKSKARAA